MRFIGAGCSVYVFFSELAAAIMRQCTSVTDGQTDGHWHRSISARCIILHLALKMKKLRSIRGMTPYIYLYRTRPNDFVNAMLMIDSHHYLAMCAGSSVYRPSSKYRHTFYRAKIFDNRYSARLTDCPTGQSVCVSMSKRLNASSNCSWFGITVNRIFLT